VETPPKLVSLREAARLLGTSHMTVRRMVNEGRLPTVRLRANGQPRVPVAAIEEFIDQQLASS
jgi:excisionase family DNA binding protein